MFEIIMVNNINIRIVKKIFFKYSNIWYFFSNFTNLKYHLSCQKQYIRATNKIHSYYLRLFFTKTKIGVCITIIPLFFFSLLQIFFYLAWFCYIIKPRSD